MEQDVELPDEIDVESFIETVADITPLSGRQAQIYVLRKAGLSASEVQDHLSIDKGEDVEKRTIQNHQYTADSRLDNRINMLALDMPYKNRQRPGVIVESVGYTLNGSTSVYHLIKQLPDIELVDTGAVSGDDWKYAVIRQKETENGFSIDYDEFGAITDFKSQIYESQSTDFLNILSAVRLYEAYTGEELSWEMIEFPTESNSRVVEQAVMNGYLESTELEKVLASYNSIYPDDVLIGTYPSSNIGVVFEDMFNQPIVIAGGIGSGKTFTSKILSQRLLSTDEATNVICADFLGSYLDFAKEMDGYVCEYTDGTTFSPPVDSRFNYLSAAGDIDATTVIEELIGHIKQTEFSEENKLLLVLDGMTYFLDKDEEKAIELYTLIQDTPYVGILMTTQTMDAFTDVDTEFSEDVYSTGSFILHRCTSISSEVAESLGMSEAIKAKAQTAKVGTTDDFAEAVVREKSTGSWKPIEVRSTLKEKLLSEGAEERET